MNEMHDFKYVALVKDVLKNGVFKEDRTGTGTKSVFSRQMRFDISDGNIPVLTVKKMFVKGIIVELLWLISGSQNIKPLRDEKVHIWDEWADDDGNIGPIYGPELRGTIDGYDQLSRVINMLKSDPSSRRMVVSYFNKMRLPIESLTPQENVRMGYGALAPCHYTWQLYTQKLPKPNADYPGGYKVSLDMTQRSCDLFLGVPFNIAQYSILLAMICQVTGNMPGEFIWSGKDVHIYNNHIEQCKELIERYPYESPKLFLNKYITDIDNFTKDDIKILDYNSHQSIKAQISV
jgi:thymidylate synthase